MRHFHLDRDCRGRQGIGAALLLLALWLARPGASGAAPAAPPPASAAAAAAVPAFVHPGGAYGLQPPDGYARHAFVHAQGVAQVVPYHVFTPDPGEEPAGYRRGMWVYAFPIVTDDQLDLTSAADIVARALANQSGLSVRREAKAPARLGSLDALSMAAEGTRGGNPWKGQVLVAVQQDNYLACLYGAPQAEWDAVRGKCEAALKTFVAPVKLTAIEEPPVPAQTQRARDVSDALLKATPLVNVKWRKSVKDDATLGPEFSFGSGFIIRDDGYVITNRHVVASETDESGAGRVAYDPVRLTWDQTTGMPPAEADVVAVSYLYDLALLKIRPEKGAAGAAGAAARKWPVAPLADITNVKLGDQVLVAGWPDPSRFGNTAMNLGNGSLTAIVRDGHGRPAQLRHNARTTSGNSGGPIYDLDVGAVIGVHYLGLLSKVPKADAGPEGVEILYHAAVPVQRILSEFPQIATAPPAGTAAGAAGAAGAAAAAAAAAKLQSLSPQERDLLIAYYYQQKRFGAAMVECRRALADDPQDGLASAYQYRIYQAQRDEARADDCLQVALSRPQSKVLATVLASEAALENEDDVDAAKWAAKLLTENPYGREGRVAMARCEIQSGSSIGVKQMLNLLGNPGQEATFQDDAEMQMILGRVLVQEWMNYSRVRHLPAERGPDKSVALEAKVALNHAMELWPGYRGICDAYLAILAAQNGEATKAMELREKAIKANPDDLDVRLTVAEFDLLRGDPVAAKEQIALATGMKRTLRGNYLLGWFLGVSAGAAERAKMLPEAQAQRLQSLKLLKTATDEFRKVYWRETALEVQNAVRKAYQDGQSKLEQ